MTTIRLTSKKHGDYNAYIADNHTMMTDLTGDVRIDLSSVMTNRTDVDDGCGVCRMVPAIRTKLRRAGVDADAAIVLFGSGARITIARADNVAAILPHIRSALAARRAREAAAAEREKYRREIYLSSRGWGDYTPVVWCGDIRRPAVDIAAECVYALAHAQDVDTPLTADEVAAKVAAAKAAEDAAAAKAAEDETKVAAAIAEAKATGRPVVLASWITDDCHAHLTECSFDRAERCAMPDGSVHVRYTHCW